MAIILFDNHNRNRLYPLTFTRSVANLRFGILTIKERWENLSKQPVFISTEDYLQALYPEINVYEAIWIDASILLNDTLLDKILSLEKGHCLVDGKGLIAGNCNQKMKRESQDNFLNTFSTINQIESVKRLEHPWQLMQWNDEMIREDFALVTKARISQPIPSSVNVINQDAIFIEPGANLSFCTLNASTGPIYIGADAEIMEGSSIRGPFVLGNKAVLKMNSKVYGATTIGPNCMGGGEIKNTVMMGNSNKAHDGYLGDSVVGEWCNFGAGSTNSNLKNTAGLVKMWDMGAEEYQTVGQKCGVVIGDYSRVSINSSINTGTVIGVSANVFGAGLLPTIIPNFTWGVGQLKYDFEKAIKAIINWKNLKNQELSPIEISLLQHINEKF